MKVISIYHNKGGVGKTTISVNLAAALRNMKYKVLLIDLDAQANATFATGLVKFYYEEDDDLVDNNVYHILSSSKTEINHIRRLSDEFNTPPIDVIPSHVKLIENQRTLVQKKINPRILRSKLMKVEGEYDYVILDTPPARDIYAQIALLSADYLIIPSDLKPFSTQGLNAVKQFINNDINPKRTMIKEQPLKILGVLASKITTNHKAFAATYHKQKENITNNYHIPMLNNIIFDRVSLSHCLSRVEQPMSHDSIPRPSPKSIFDYMSLSQSSEKAAAKVSANEFIDLAKEVVEKTT